MTKISIVTRQFEPNAEAEDYKKTKFKEKFKKDFFEPLYNLTKDSKNIERVVVVFCGDQNVKWGEKYDNKREKPASYSCIQELTTTCENPEGWKINGIDIVPVISTNWGNNAGSATAINEGLAQVETDLVLIWSKQMQLNSKNIDDAITLINQKELRLIGFLREGWNEENNSWNVPQNTAAIWLTKDLKEIRGFSEICNGVKGEELEILIENKIEITDFAGMEDLEALIRLLKIYPEFKYTMMGKNNPVLCTHGKKEDSVDERKRNQIKKLRQPLVIDYYFKMHYPNGEKNLESLLLNMELY